MRNSVKLGWAAAFGLLVASSAAWGAAGVTVNGTAAMNGTSFGMSVNLDGTATNAFVVSQHPTDETHFLFRFFINPGTVNITPGTALRIGAVGDEAAAVVRGGWKAIRPLGRPALLFDLEQDPGETRDLSAAQPRRLALLLRALSRMQPVGSKGLGVAPPKDSELAEELRALGYI